MMIITSLHHPLASKTELPFSVLQDYPVIGYDYDSGLGLYTHKLYRKHHIKPDIVIDCPDEYSIAALVSEDFGIALVADVDTIRDAKITKIPVANGGTYPHSLYGLHERQIPDSCHKPVYQVYQKRVRITLIRLKLSRKIIFKIPVHKMDMPFEYTGYFD